MDAITTKSRDTSERRRQITAMLKQRGSVQVIPLAELFAVSTQTIRKDLHYLQERGIATRAYGGAISSDVIATEAGAIPQEPEVEIKRTINVGQKAQIGRLAASLVQPGDAILLDSGTTTTQIAHFLPENADITVVTNDFAVLAVLTEKQGINVVMLGGSLRRKNMAFYGAQTEAAIADLLVDKLFLGVDGFDLTKGITTHYEPEAMLNRKMVEVAREVIVVTDSSKFNRVCLHRIAEAQEIDILVTDSGIPAEIHDGEAAFGCKIMIAD